MMDELEAKAEKYCDSLIGGDFPVNDLWREEILKSYIVGAKENVIVWHDLRKNHDDLPPLVGCRYLVSSGYTSMVGYWNGSVFVSSDADSVEIAGVIAWCEIPICKIG